MNIRTITTGFNLKVPIEEEQIRKIAEFTNSSKNIFEKKGYIVQTTRIATQPWEEYFKSKKQLIQIVKLLDEYCKKYNLSYFNIGNTTNHKLIPIIYNVIKNSSVGFCTALISDDKTINYLAAKQAAKLIKRLSRIDKDGFANLRFAVLFNTKAGSPFYPAAYHKGQTSFAIGTENSDLVYKAFLKAKDIQAAPSVLKRTLAKEYSRVESIAKQISKRERVKYDGIDVSIATSVKPTESIAFAFENLALGRFGDAGTLTVAKIITDTLKGLSIKKCGYSGLMLPVLEDYGLAKRNNEETYNITNLLLYSAVCGTGLDTIPLAGNVSEKKLYALLLDIASLSIKLNKPLSARLMPVPNKKAGMMTTFGFEYFANCKIMKL